MKMSSFLKTLLGVAVAPKVLAEIDSEKKQKTKYGNRYAIIIERKYWGREGDYVISQDGRIGIINEAEDFKYMVRYVIEAVCLNKGFYPTDTFKNISQKNMY